MKAGAHVRLAVIAGLVLGVAACAQNPPPRGAEPAPDGHTRAEDDGPAAKDVRPAVFEPPRSPAELLGSAVIALEMHNYPRARVQLQSARKRCPASRVGRQAALLLAAAELDPRNMEGSPQRAADLMASYLREGGGGSWTGPIAETLYLQSLQMGAEAPADGTAASDSARRSVAHREEDCDEGLSAAESSMAARGVPALPGAALARRLEQLQVTVSALKAELERIRQTLEP